MIQFQENPRTDGRTDRPYFIGHFRQPLGIQQLHEHYLSKLVIPSSKIGMVLAVIFTYPINNEFITKVEFIIATFSS